MRVLWLLTVALLLATAIWGRLVYWQVLEHSRLASAAQAQYTQHVVLPAQRGRIFDRNMRPLAVNTTAYSVFVSPQYVQTGQRAAVAQGLTSVLGLPLGQVTATLESGKAFAYVAHREPQAVADRLRRLALPGVGLEPDQQRSYLPGGESGASLAANLLGFVNSSGTGLYGVEQRYDAQLAGRPGSSSTYTDQAGNQVVLGAGVHRDAVNGADLTLTLDSNIEYAAEQALEAGVKAAHAVSGSVLIMDPATGGIVASADYPSYNANQYYSTDVSRFLDDTVSYQYEPGSVMKVVTLGGALDAHAITPQTTINDPGVISVGGYAIHDWDFQSHGTVTMTQVLEESLNVGAIRAMMAEGPQTYYHYLQAFGFGRPSGVDVAAESSTPLRPYPDWRPSNFATASFGQGVAVNMEQMLAAVNVIADNGRYAQPHVVADVGGRPAAAAERPQRQVISPQAAAQMKWMMTQVVQHGSGWKSCISGFQLDEAGKTGTSNIPVNGKYTGDVWASYVGFMPASHPRFTMLVVIRKPHNGSNDHNEGYYVAAPVWKQIAQDIILQWRITPQGTSPGPGAVSSGCHSSVSG
ncbi:MAG: peptidoglycan D,D-transpeptidase FtsI family protein [Candidatus Dormibacteraceae bacterium]